jgi:diaminopimelate decarboxylase
VVSEGELHRALAAGMTPDKIVFAGVGKTAREMAFGLDSGILQFNVESLPELELLSQVARDKGVTAPVGLRFNPDVDARTHAGGISAFPSDTGGTTTYDSGPIQ